MDFEFTKEQKMIQSSARELMEKEIIPIADKYDREKALLDRKKVRELLKKLEIMGYLGGRIPEEDGGRGLSNVEFGILCEQLWRAYASLGGIIQIQEGSAREISLLGTPDQKKRFLPKLLTGELIACTANTEPNVGSDASSIETEATLHGDHYILNGTKTWISNGSISDIAIVIAQTEPGSGATGICHLIVEKTVSPYETNEIPKMGVRSFPTSELVFSDCRVPKENLLVPPGQGLHIFLNLLQGARTIISIGMVGISQAAIEAAVRYAKQRHQFGKPIGGFQLIQGMIAEMIAETEAARLLAYQVFSKLDKGMRCDKEVAVAKFYATDMARRVTFKAIEIHGAYGLAEELPLERYYRDASSFSIPDGTTEIQKLIVGRSALGMGAFR